MQSNFNNRDFEQFIKENADQYRMFPSEKVWKGIHSSLHTRRKWYSIAFALLLLTIGSVTWIMVTPSGSKKTLSAVSPASSDESVKKANQPVSKQEQKISGITINNLPVEQPVVSIGSANIAANNPPAVPDSEAELPSVVYTAAQPADIIYPAPVVADATTVPEEKANQTLEPAPFKSVFTDDNADFPATAKENISDQDKKITGRNDLFPMSIESVENLYKNNSRQKRLTVQLYFTPTVSYRKLRENKSYLRAAQFATTPYAIAALYDINSVVTHKPDMGMELGLATRYQLSKNVKLKGGLQLNVSRYDIKAFTYNGEVATIALNSGYDSVRSWTNYRNFGGYATNWLQNLYVSLSAPIGAELKLAGDDKTSLGVGGTVQPTYIVGDRAYLISSDYKNYAEVPWLIRRWNVSTSLETFVSYSTGKLRWQVGPQVRYQLLSSFKEKYPVRENLFDFGLKVGITLTK